MAVPNIFTIQCTEREWYIYTALYWLRAMLSECIVLYCIGRAGEIVVCTVSGPTQLPPFPHSWPWVNEAIEETMNNTVYRLNPPSPNRSLFLSLSRLPYLSPLNHNFLSNVSWQFFLWSIRVLSFLFSSFKGIVRRETRVILGCRRSCLSFRR